MRRVLHALPHGSECIQCRLGARRRLRRGNVDIDDSGSGWGRSWWGHGSRVHGVLFSIWCGANVGNRHLGKLITEDAGSASAMSGSGTRPCVSCSEDEFISIPPEARTRLFLCSIRPEYFSDCLPRKRGDGATTVGDLHPEQHAHDIDGRIDSGGRADRSLCGVVPCSVRQHQYCLLLV